MDFVEKRKILQTKKTQPRKPKNPIIVLQGYFVYFDKFFRAKLMFLDDYDAECETKNSVKKDNTLYGKTFTKRYITSKAHKTNSLPDSYSPMSDDKKYFFVKCKDDSCGLVDLDQNKPRLLPIRELIQHKVEIIAKVNNYKFTTQDNELKQGWNLNLIKIKLLEY